MTFFESLLLLLLMAILLLQVSRRLLLPYPAMLALTGVAVALIPGTPAIRLDPETALALFIAPVLVDAAFDFPVAAVKKLWRPLVALAIVAVLFTTLTVAWTAVAVTAMPIAAAFALGAIVAPPDAAAVTAVLNNVSLPTRTITVLRGESLFNDASALVLFGAAVALQSHGRIDGEVAARLALSVPGGILFGIGLGLVYPRLSKFVAGTLGGTLLEFISAFGVWILARWLGLSAVLCTVTFAMTLAHSVGSRRPRLRVHSYAVWATVVFLLNVLAFMLMGMQARLILDSMPPDRLSEAATFAALVIAVVIAGRIVWVLIYNRLATRFRQLRGTPQAATLRLGLLIGWCGMRGLVTLATALALPLDFPQRDLIVLTAFAVVLATLVIQGITLIPVIRLLGLDHDGGYQREVVAARRDLLDAGLAALDDHTGEDADALRLAYQIRRDAMDDEPKAKILEERRVLALKGIRAQRFRLDALRTSGSVNQDLFNRLQEELDWKELSLVDEDERSIEES